MRSCGFSRPIGEARWWWFAGLVAERGTSSFKFSWLAMYRKQGGTRSRKRPHGPSFSLIRETILFGISDSVYSRIRRDIDRVLT